LSQSAWRSAVRRGRRATRGLIASSLAVALVAAACGVVIVAAGADAYLGATVPACSTDESRPTLSYCSHPGDLGRQAGAVGVLGGLLAGVVGGALAAWRRSRSLRIVTGGTVAALGAAVLAVEALIVLVLWSH
jgi:hypothetical protein